MNESKLIELNKKNIFLTLIISLFLSFCLEFYIILVENPDLYHLLKNLNFLNTIIPLISFKHLILFFIVFIIFITIILNKNLKEKVCFYLYKYRFLIGGLIVIVGVLFELHGSSIACFHLSDYSHKALFGIPRTIRSDEFNVFTPFSLSQYYNNFGYYSHIVGGTTTDMALTYCQPIWDVVTLFRPFLIGYLFLTPEKGLSFFWIGRLVALFLVSFEMGMILTKKNKTLSLVYTLLLTFSPVVQWWFAINSLVEMLIFGQLAIILIDKYFNVSSYYTRLLIALELSLSIGSFLIALYPAWEVPLAYVFFMLFIWVLYENKNKIKINIKDILLVLLVIGIVGLTFCHLFIKSYDTLLLTINTIYPGHRTYIGGEGEITDLFYYIKTIIYPIIPLYSSEIPVRAFYGLIIDLFPIGLIMFIIVQFKQKRNDLLLYGLILIEILFLIYFCFPLPEIIGSVTLLNKTIYTRLMDIITFINLLILIRSISLFKKPEFEINNKILYILCLVCALILFILTNNQLKLCIIVIIFSVVFYFTFRYCFDKNKTTGFIISILIISFLAGGLVNPIESGLDFYYESEPIQAVAEIVQNNPNGLWLIEGNIYIDEIIGVGAPTINSVHTYPDFSLYSKLDPENKSIDIYNRYAHIPIFIQNTSETTFAIPEVEISSNGAANAAQFIIGINVNDLNKINASYIMSTVELEGFSNDNVSFIRIYDDGVNRIYKINYR